MAAAQEGRLIIFEGPDDAGKTTQAELLETRFQQEGIDTLLVREPGGTPLGESLRHMLLEDDLDLHPRTEVLLFNAARSELIQKRVVPALKEGKTVVLDRFVYSTLVYQVLADRGYENLEAEEDATTTICAYAIGPDFLGSYERLNRMFFRNPDSHLQAHYDKLADCDPEIIVINSLAQSKEETAQIVWDALGVGS